MLRCCCILLIALNLACAQSPEEVGRVAASDSTAVPFRGVNWVSTSGSVPAHSFDHLQKINANSVAIVPFGFISEEPRVFYNLDWQWWGERKEGVSELIKDARSRGLQVMVKPQVWITQGAHGSFTGDYDAGSEEGWQSVEQSYYDYILFFARLADSLDCQLFCIGTEFKNFHQQRPQFWSMLIDSVRANFKGQLTYAGNWDSYQSFPHWPKLDYIGIDAYFPVSDQQTPTVENCKAGWQPWLQSIQQHQQQLGKPVIFTEFGYRSLDYCAKEPWHSSHSDGVNLQAQQNAYEALFQVFWDQAWFTGGFLWKWFPDHQKAGGMENNRFTPQNKPVEKTIGEWYSSKER